MKNEDSNLGDPAVLGIWVDNGWSIMVDLIDKIGSGAEVKTLFFGEGVETSKKRCQ